MRIRFTILCLALWGCGQLPGVTSESAKKEQQGPGPEVVSEDAKGKKQKKAPRPQPKTSQDPQPVNPGSALPAVNPPPIPASNLSWDGEIAIGSANLQLIPTE